MKPVDTVAGTMVSLPQADIDTDQIIPQKHLKRIERTGYGEFLFDYWANDQPDFTLNDPARAKAKALITGPNFGCGSSREHAVWAIRDRGFEVVVGPSFADIFSGNAVNNGLLLVQLPEAAVNELHDIAIDPDATVHVSLEDQEVRAGDRVWKFEIDPEVKRRLLAGLDMVGVTLEYEDAISAYERQ